jgi:dihydrofolate reductase
MFNHPVERKGFEMSRRVVAYEWMSLDGVVQAPGAPAEDRDGGFEHGGWHLRYFDDASRQWVLDGLNRASAFLLGRRTYENFASTWPNVTGPESVVAEPLNTKPKYVASRTLTDPRWAHTSVLPGDAVKAVAELRATDGGEIHLIGSAELARTLLAHDLIDELHLMVDPVLLGTGKRLFPSDAVLRELTLTSSRPVSTGALLLAYARG